VRTIFNSPAAPPTVPLAATRDHDGRWIGGSTDQWGEELTAAVLDHSASGFTLVSPKGDTPDAFSRPLGSVGRSRLGCWPS
jgi:hypothetical protein